MVCIYCHSSTQVVNSRPQKRLNQVWRRRHCPTCGATFTTEEVTNYAESWRVGSSKSLVPFNKYRLFLSLYKSLEHRPTAVADAEGLTNTIISLLSTQTHQGRLEAVHIAVLSAEVLRNFDSAAAVHYQAFHPASA